MVPLDPRSIFFLNPNQGWVVTAEGLFQTDDAARHWRRILKSQDLLRCWFTSAVHGYAVGDRKTAMETLDGGKNVSFITGPQGREIGSFSLLVGF